jgi:hypothetical protein
MYGISENSRGKIKSETLERRKAKIITLNK